MRSAGILLHPTSLPGRHGIGEAGPEARQFVDFLASAEQCLWQILPLNPTGPGYSPYSSTSAFASSPLLISLDRLVEDGILASRELSAHEGFSADRVDYEKVVPWKMGLLRESWQRCRGGQVEGLTRFREANSDWVEDYALFIALKNENGGLPWNEWDIEKKHGDFDIEATRGRLREEIDFQIFLQFMAAKHWGDLKSYANRNGIRIIGDLPIFVAYDSSDVWAQRDNFLLDADDLPSVVAGVPPDYFSETGQLWGNPLYCWDRMRQDGYHWWVRRFAVLGQSVDLVRVDHFRGFEAYWEVARGEETAMNGKWVPGPGVDLLNSLSRALPKVEIIAEDLGVITPEVVALRREAGFPGMVVLQFAFDGDEKNNYLPARHEVDSVVYTGTHDNDTTLGWYKKLDEKTRKCLLKHLGKKTGKIQNRLIELAYESKAKYAIIPLQDVIGLDSTARMNIPGVGDNNWRWRFNFEQLGSEKAVFLRELAGLNGRLRTTGNIAI